MFSIIAEAAIVQSIDNIERTTFNMQAGNTVPLILLIFGIENRGRESEKKRGKKEKKQKTLRFA